MRACTYYCPCVTRFSDIALTHTSIKSLKSLCSRLKAALEEEQTGGADGWGLVVSPVVREWLIKTGHKRWVIGVQARVWDLAWACRSADAEWLMYVGWSAGGGGRGFTTTANHGRQCHGPRLVTASSAEPPCSRPGRIPPQPNPRTIPGT